MTTHIAKPVSIRRIAPGLLEIAARCCGDPTSEQRLTLGGLDRSEAVIDQKIQEHCEKVASAHKQDELALDHVKRLAGEGKTYKGCCP
jgi:hypothetical protein